MVFGRWVLAALAGGLALGSLDAQAAPVLLMGHSATAPAQAVQYYYYDEEDEPPLPDEDDEPALRRYRDPSPYRGYDMPRRGFRPQPPAFERSRRGEARDWEEAREAPRPRRENPRGRTRPWSQDNGY